MSSIQQSLMRQLRNQPNNKLMILDADKNLGQAVADTTYITRRAVIEHLSNEDVYKKLPERQARTLQRGFEIMMESFINKADFISPAERTFLKRGLQKCKATLSRFYMTAKVHKLPSIQHRPIVANCYTPQHVLSRWLDYTLKQVVQYVGTYIKDSSELLDKLESLNLPPNARLFKADANKMYTCIDTKHGLDILKRFLQELEVEGNLPLHFHIDLIVKAASLVMKSNIFKFGDCFFLQQRGCAMGTPFACVYATIYFWMHEKHVLIPKNNKTMPLLVRYIDDIFGIILEGGNDGMSSDEIKQLEADLNAFGPGILTWDMDKPSKSIDYLDLTITIDNGRITTQTFCMPLNLYQYITTLSNHPFSIIKGMIYGILKQYYRQNSNREDYFKNDMLFYKYLTKRGWQADTIDAIFIRAHNKIVMQSKQPPSITTTQDDTSLKKLIILHHVYHSHGISRKEIRAAYDKCLGSLLSRDTNDGGLGIERTIVAFHRPPNLRDLLQSSILRQVEGSEVSTYFGG